MSRVLGGVYTVLVLALSAAGYLSIAWTIWREARARRGGGQPGD